jgi:hypothetical protein
MDTAYVEGVFDEFRRDWDTTRLNYDERVIEQLAASMQLTGEQTVVDAGTLHGIRRGRPRGTGPPCYQIEGRLSPLDPASDRNPGIE